MRHTHILSQKASHQHEKCQHTDNPARASALSHAQANGIKYANALLLLLQCDTASPLSVSRGDEKWHQIILNHASLY